MQNTTTGSDQELLRLSMAGDEDAFMALYHRYQGRIYRFALLMSGSAAIADDVTQEVFVVLLHEAKRYDASRGTLSGYMYGIARNQVLRNLHRVWAYLSLDGEAEEGGEDREAFQLPQLIATSDPLSELTRKEMIHILRKAVLGLPPRYREVIVLCDFHEMSHAEAAVALDCAMGTVASRLNRARIMLADRLRATGKLDSTSISFELKKCVI